MNADERRFSPIFQRLSALKNVLINVRVYFLRSFEVVAQGNAWHVAACWSRNFSSRGGSLSPVNRRIQPVAL